MIENIERKEDMGMRIKALIIIVILSFSLLSPLLVLAAPVVILNGDVLSFDSPPFIENGRTMVPMSTIFRALGAKISWDSYTNTVTAVRENMTIKLRIGSTTALKNNAEIVIDAAPEIVDSRTFVPLAFVGQSLGAEVKWDAATSSIYINSGKSNPVVDSQRTLLKDASEIYDLCNPSIVYVELYDQRGVKLGSGSGVIASNDGKVITNYHVISAGYSAKAKLFNGKMVDVLQVLNYDSENDLAIIKIDSHDLTSIKLGDSDKILNGERVVAIGCPKGLENTVSDGLISNKSRTVEYRQFIQTSTPISPGSSGGALLNYWGELIGITSNYYVNGQNLNFAIPVNIIKPMLDKEKSKSVKEVFADASEDKDEIEIDKAELCSKWKEKDISAIDPTNEFNKDVHQIAAVVSLSDLPAKPIKITGNWYYITSTGTKTLIYSKEITTAVNETVTVFVLTGSGPPFNIGHWQFEALVNHSCMVTDFMISK